MSASADPLACIRCKVERIESYSGRDSAKVPVYRPADAVELARIFAYARSARPQRRVTLRGGGHSFDAQSINTDLVVSMEGFDSILIDEASRLITVGPGATWGDILCRLQPLGLVPAVTVTTSHATAGGTLAGDCLSRFSSAWGKEGKFVERFEFLALDGRTFTCRRPPADAQPGQWTLPERIFLGAIGGLGYLGAFLSITYEVVPTGQTAGKIGVKTRVHRCQTFEELTERLETAANAVSQQEPDAANPDRDDAIYSALGPGRGNEQSLLMTSSFRPDRNGRRMLLFEPYRWFRVSVELLVRLRAFNRFLWWFSFTTRFGYRRHALYVDGLPDFTFFLDGNVRAKKLIRRWTRYRLKTIQQTFVVPGKREHLLQWLLQAKALLDDRRLRPTLSDVLYLPKDLPFALSATADEAGYAVSYAFETSRRRELERVGKAFEDLAEILHGEPYGGRVYLVKNVCAEEDTLIAMYGENAERFFELKAELDPDGILCNAFLERTFGKLLVRPAGTSAPPAPAGGRLPSAAG
jgi:decaprenylphospho-beta-D-ribofuranose 2-oxidase